MLLPESVQHFSMSWRPQQCVSTPDFTKIQWKLRLSRFGMRRSDTPCGIVRHEDDALHRWEWECLGREHGEEWLVVRMRDGEIWCAMRWMGDEGQHVGDKRATNGQQMGDEGATCLAYVQNFKFELQFDYQFECWTEVKIMWTLELFSSTLYLDCHIIAIWISSLRVTLNWWPMETF